MLLELSSALLKWFNLEGLFSWYQRDHSTPQPVEFIHEPHPSPEAIRSVLTTAITFTDEYILTYFLERTFGSPSKKNAPQAMLGAASSCMVSALYEADVRVLHVASLGNMRGILGRPRETDDGKITYDVHVLSVDHSPENPAEKALIESAHEGEDVLADGTLFGRPYTRALGDGKLKWNREIQTRLHRDYLSAAPDPNVKTPPYISAKPDVNSIKILPGDFLVLSSRWLAECLTDEEVVGLVGVWLEKNKDTTLYLPKESPPPPPAQEGPPKKIEVLLPEDLPVTLKGDKTTFFRRWDVAKRFINEDANASTHLMTNAMGGADEDLREALVQMVPSQSEGNTKSLAIVVAFFQ
ncbi:phosphatase 2C-like domain-containing protein [Mycena galericulata]|nr:phosphatase 2C-like domain-containing protein [Mycena galericulata]